ncbi:MAG TPA: RNA polymerase sigma factor [Anaeromyxobacteraceae bacterium]|nr:RNA polymerase sigma factor [Anaeromyxobacteraceae bacterium]
MTTATASTLELARDATLSDEEVVRRVRAGETALYEVLMRRHNPRVYRAIRSVIRDEVEVEDAMQQAYLAAFAKLDQFTGAARFSTWLVSIALNEAHTRIRRKVRVRALSALEEGPSVTGETPENEADMRERVARVEKELDSLPDGYRTVLMLRVVQDLDTDETAAVLGVSTDVVKTRLHRARTMLRDAIERELDGAARSAFPFLAPRCDRVVAGVFARLPRS